MDIKNLANDILIDGVVGCHIELFSNKKLIIEGCYGIIEYNENFVRINLSKGEVQIFGSKLEIFNMVSDTITVKGVIDNIEFIGV